MTGAPMVIRCPKFHQVATATRTATGVEVAGKPVAVHRAMVETAGPELSREDLQRTAAGLAHWTARAGSDAAQDRAFHRVACRCGVWTWADSELLTALDSGRHEWILSPTAHRW